jgi:hypothetical protein
MEKITKRVRIKKDYFLYGKISVHITKYRNGKISYDSVLNYFSTKKQAQLFKRSYIIGKEVNLAYPNISYKEFIKK